MVNVFYSQPWPYACPKKANPQNREGDRHKHHGKDTTRTNVASRQVVTTGRCHRDNFSQPRRIAINERRAPEYDFSRNKIPVYRKRQTRRRVVSHEELDWYTDHIFGGEGVGCLVYGEHRTSLCDRAIFERSVQLLASLILSQINVEICMYRVMRVQA